MTFAVSINDSPRYVVHSKSVLGAVKSALAASEALGGTPKVIEPVRIEVMPLTGKATA